MNDNRGKKPKGKLFNKPFTQKIMRIKIFTT